MIEFIEKYLDLIITGVLSGTVGWIVERKRKKAEVKQVESDAIKSMQGAYNTFVEDMKANYAELKADYTEVKAELSDVKLELADYKNKYHSLKKEMYILENGINTTPNIGKGKKPKAK